MLIILLYELALWMLAFVSIPKLLYGYYFQKKYTNNFLERLGWGWPTIEKNGRPLIWLHAVSVGEVKALSSLAKRLKEELPKCLIIVTSVTKTGKAEAKRSIPFADYHLFFPFDFYFIMARLLKRVQPDYILISETDFWFNFLRLAKRLGAKIALINGKISERSFTRLQKVPFWTASLFSQFELFCLQSQLYGDRYLSLGVSAHKIKITGNLKFDLPPIPMSESEEKSFREKLKLKESDQTIVIGSSHEPEEKLILAAIKELICSDQKIKVIVVPRHPERFQAVEKCIKQLNLPYMRFSEANEPPSDFNPSLILMDAMGILGKCYQIASIAIVAGSYTSSVGGHNILEPLWFKVPMIHGPYMHSQPDMVTAVKNYSAGCQVEIAAIKEKISELLTDPREAERLQEAALKLTAELRGAAERTAHSLRTHLFTLPK